MPALFAGVPSGRLALVLSATGCFLAVAVWALVEVARNMVLERRAHRDAATAVSGSRTRVQIHMLLVIANALRAGALCTDLWMAGQAYSDTYEWVGCLVHFAPDLFYLMLYGLLVLLWAALHHDTAPSTHTLLTRLFWAMVIAIIGGFSCIAVLSFIRRRPSGFWRLSELFLGVVYVLALGIALFYGCLVVNKLRPPPLKVTAGDDGSRFNGRRGGDPARESLTSPNPEDVAAQSAVMRRVLALCALCVVFFLLRGTLNLVSVFGLLPQTTGGMPFMDPVSGEHTEASILFDVCVAGASELLPSILMLLVTRHRTGGPDTGSAHYPTSDITRSSSMPDVLDGRGGYDSAQFGSGNMPGRGGAEWDGSGGRFMPVRSNSVDHLPTVTGPYDQGGFGYPGADGGIGGWGAAPGVVPGHGRGAVDGFTAIHNSSDGGRWRVSSAGGARNGFALSARTRADVRAQHLTNGHGATHGATGRHAGYGATGASGKGMNGGDLVLGPGYHSRASFQGPA